MENGEWRIIVEAEEVGGVDVADDVVDVFVVDEDLGVAGLDEGLFQLFDGGGT